ncbi:MAG TPA: hypothetical protein VL443_24335 [Cyclobacteriaceae bacterium]|jgi:hypothetical protein|nr:hypothetical protein [Cyclobacteriaceae bacterium]
MAKQIYDLDKDDMVDVVEPPASEKKVEDKTKTEPDPAEEEEEEEEEVKTTAEKEKEKTDPEEEEEEEETEEEKAARIEAEKKEKEQEEEETEESVDKILESKFGEKYGIKSEEDLSTILSESEELLDEVASLREENKALKEKPNTPSFKSKTNEAVYNALKDYDIDKLSDGIHMIAGLISMDLDKTDPKLILEQAFIMEHPELSLDKARKKFQRRFDEKYTIQNADDLDPADLKEKKEDLESDLEIDAAKAKKFIKEKQADFKTKSEDKVETEEVPKEIQEGIASHTKEFQEHMTGIDELIFADDDNDKHPFRYKFSKEELGQIKKIVGDHLSNPNAYDGKGKLVGGFDPEEKFQQAAFLVAGPKMVEEARKSAARIAQIIKVEDVAQKKPKRKAVGSGDIQDDSIDAQAERMAKKKEAERKARR